MGANGSFSKGTANTEEGREFKTVWHLSDTVKVIQRKNPKASVKLPEESNTPNRAYAVFYADGHDLKEVGVYGADGKKLYEIHTIAHRPFGLHYHVWKDGRPVSVHPATAEMIDLINRIRNFKK